MAESIHYKFVVNGLNESSFTLIQFEGFEAISSLYEYTLEIKHSETDPESLTEDLLKKRCQLQTFLNDKLLKTLHGVIAEVAESRYLSDGVIYHVKLVPNIWNLRHFETNEVYINQSIPEIIDTVMEEFGLATEIDYQQDISSALETTKWEFKLQYKEQHLDFLQRITERDGIYYYFEHGDNNEVIVYSDQECAAAEHDIDFAPAGSSENVDKPFSVSNFICRSKRLPKNIRFRDYNPLTPSQDIAAETSIDTDGEGCINLYGLNIRTAAEATRLADTHAQAFKCRKHQFIGEGNLPILNAGHVFSLKKHPRDKYNTDYLVTEMQVSGANISYFQQNHESAPPVSNCNFTCIKASEQFVPMMKAEKPVITGTLHAIIDGDGSTGDHAMIDKFGRYKVKLPFDRKNNEDAKASHWIRMAQPFGGEDEGMHFPLRKDTNVLLSFIGGDPDNPVIASTIGDGADQSSVVSEDNHTNKVIKTAKGNKIEIEDLEGSNRIKLESLHSNTYFHLGAPNAAGDGFVSLTQGMKREVIERGSQKTYTAKSGLLTKNIGENQATASSDKKALQKIPGQLFTFETDANTPGNGTRIEPNPDLTSTNPPAHHELKGTEHYHRRQGNLYDWSDGMEFHYNNGNVYNFGSSWEETHANPGFNSTTNTSVLNSKSVQHTFSHTVVIGSHNPPNMISTALNKIDEQSQVSVVFSDTVNYQKGANFNWGDTEDYNFGNGYEENLITHEKINADQPHDKSKVKDSTVAGKKLNLNRDHTLVEKTIGHTYEYQRGQSISVAVGNSEEHTHNDVGDLVSYANTNSSNGIKSEDHTTAAQGIVTTETISSGTGVAESWTLTAGEGAAFSDIVAAGAGVATNDIVAAGAGVASNEIVAAGAAIASNSITAAAGAVAGSEITAAVGMIATSEITAAKGMVATNEIVAAGALLATNDVKTCTTHIENEVDLTGIRIKTEVSPSGSHIELSVPGTDIKTEIKPTMIEMFPAITIEEKKLELGRQALLLEGKELEVANKALELSTGALKLIS